MQIPFWPCKKRQEFGVCRDPVKYLTQSVHIEQKWISRKVSILNRLTKSINYILAMTLWRWLSLLIIFHPSLFYAWSVKFYTLPFIPGLTLRFVLILKSSHKILCDSSIMFEKASSHIETVRLSLLDGCISASICLKELITSSFILMSQYFQQISSAQNILP